MLHTKVYGYFKDYLPAQAEKADVYFPNGKNSIRIRNKDGSEFIFTCLSPKDWCYETLNIYIKRMKGVS